MKYFIILLTLLFNLNLAYAQDSIRYKEVDDFVKNFPLKVNSLNDLTTLQREIKYKFKNDEEKLARAAFIWITNNIEYDYEGFKKGENFYTHQLNDVIVKKKAVCAGYANLFKNFCNYFELNCHRIDGYVYTYNDSLLDEKNFKANHAWNIVGVNKEWKIVDATWGSGSSNVDCSKYYKQLYEKYFFADPKDIIKTHFPKDSFWQLLPKPYAFNELKKARLEDKIKDSLDEIKRKADSVIIRNLNDTIRFYIYTQSDTLNTISITSDAQRDINIFSPVQKFENGYYYDYKIKYSGNYYVYVSYYNYKENETEFRGTENEIYLFKISKPKPSRKLTTKLKYLRKFP